jgi:hypothetical protein
MDPSCVASAAANVLGIVVQITGFLYGRWDDAGTPSAERLIYELSRLRTILQEIEEAASIVPVPLILYQLPEAFSETAKLLQQLKSRLLGIDVDLTKNERLGSSPLDWSWRTYDPGRRMRLKLTKSDAEAHLAGLQLSIAKLQQRFDATSSQAT